MSNIVNITVDQGATSSWDFILTDENTDPINISGYTAHLQVRRDYDTTATIIDASTTNGKIVITGAQGKIDVELDPDDTKDIRFQGATLEGVYDVEITSGTGVITRVAEGTFTIRREVTRG